MTLNKVLQQPDTFLVPGTAAVHKAFTAVTGVPGTHPPLLLLPRFTPLVKELAWVTQQWKGDGGEMG